MALAVSRRPLNAEARVRFRVGPCVICGGESGTGTSFSPSASIFPCQFHSTDAPLKAEWAPEPVWTGTENLAPTGFRSPDRPARSESPYRLRYSGLQYKNSKKYNY